MGLDIVLEKLIKVGPGKHTEEDIKNKFGENTWVHRICRADSNNQVKIECGEKYLFVCTMDMFDTDKMIRDGLGLSDKEWEYAGWSSYPSSYLRSEEHSDEVGMWFNFENKHGSENSEKWEEKELFIPYEDFKKWTVKEDWICVATTGEEIAYMRKGANEKFYEDGLWDDGVPVCSKKVLEEHMNKYFDAGPGYVYDNCREAFKEMIFDKFEDGMCVIYC